MSLHATHSRVPRFPENTDLVQSLRNLNTEYNKAKEEFRDTQYQLMKRCFSVGLALTMRPDEFERLKAERYWSDASRKLPTPKGKPDDVMRWAVFYMIQPKGKNQRGRVGRWAKVLCHFRDIDLPIRSVVSRLENAGGIAGIIRKISGQEPGAERAQLDNTSDSTVSDQSSDAAGLGRNHHDLDGEDRTLARAQHPKTDKHAKASTVRATGMGKYVLRVEARSRAQENRALRPGKILIHADVTEGKGDWKIIRARRIERS